MNAALKHMTPDDFLVWSLDQPDRWELVHGVPIRMMTGATRRHDAIVVNLISDLKQQLRGKPCQPNTADVAAIMPVGNVRRPDVTVDCAGLPDKSLVSEAPAAFFEVLSPSTCCIDLVRKAEEYRQVPSLRHILLIEPGSAHVAVWSRTGAESVWTSADFMGLDGTIDLPGIGVQLPLASIYEGIAFETDD